MPYLINTPRIKRLTINSLRNVLRAGFGCCVLLNLGCTPTVKVATDEPITINLNVNIKHEIRVKVEKDLDAVLSEDSGLF